jgi:hypothetical protein
MNIRGAEKMGKILHNIQVSLLGAYTLYVITNNSTMFLKQ